MKALKKQEEKEKIKQTYRDAIARMLLRIEKEEYLQRIYRLTEFLYTK